MSRYTVAKRGELLPGTAKLVQAGEKLLCLVHLDGTYHAIDELCPHRAGPLSEGIIEGRTISCPWHGAKFDLATGAVLGPPAPRGLKCYPVTVEGEDVVVDA